MKYLIALSLTLVLFSGCSKQPEPECTYSNTYTEVEYKTSDKGIGDTHQIETEDISRKVERKHCTKTKKDDNWGTVILYGATLGGLLIGR